MWRSQYIGQLEKGIPRVKWPTSQRFFPPGIDTSHKGWMALQMGVKRLLINNRATGSIHQNGIWLHPCKLLFPYEPFGGPGERQREHHHVTGTQHALYVLQRANEIHLLSACSALIERKDVHAKSAHEPGCCAPGAPAAKDASRRAGARTVEGMIINFAVP